MQTQPRFLYGYALCMVLLGVVVLTSCRHVMTASKPSDPFPNTGLKKRLAVLPFATQVETQGWRGASAVAADILTSSLFETQRFIMVERREMEKVLTEQELLELGPIDPQKAAQKGKILGVQALVLGAITQMGLRRIELPIANRTVADVAVDIRLVDTTTGEIFQAVTGVGQETVMGASFPIPRIGLDPTIQQSAERDALLQKALRKALNDVAPKLVRQMQPVPWAAYIASVERDGTYLINAGATQGLTLGTQLAVYRPGAMVIDPNTKQSIGRRKQLIGQGEVRSVETGYAAIAVKQGGPFQVNDIVQAMEKVP
jgi:curli biogenesis system outer membrane secretion channel CsgG